MKKILCAVLTLITIVACVVGCFFADSYKVTTPDYSPNAYGDITAVSFNCAAPWGNVIKGTSKNVRVKRFAAYMNAVRPDVIGTQEMSQNWQTKLEKLMPDYESYGVERGGDSEKNSEMNSVFWLKDRFDCVDKNTFWLSGTPDEESKYEGAGCYRICTYVVLKDKQLDCTVIHLNTHLDNASDDARIFGSGVILNRIEQLKIQYPDATIILTGDFNDIEDGQPLQNISRRLKSCSTVAPENKVSTYTDWETLGNDGEPIDFVFTNARPVGYAILDDESNGLVSDHYGIIAQINLK